MTNREYLENKKEMFYQKVSDFIDKHFKLLCGILYILDAVLFICVIKISVAFLALFIPLTIFNTAMTFVLIEIWLDKERKESE
ncbi:MAG: hypothetical protein J6S85_12665 [Methanobrevibacter sp.]|nr:hypothetical protein [Methanobrevibacter sp.]